MIQLLNFLWFVLNLQNIKNCTFWLWSQVTACQQKLKYIHCFSQHLTSICIVKMDHFKSDFQSDMDITVSLLIWSVKGKDHVWYARDISMLWFSMGVQQLARAIILNLFLVCKVFRFSVWQLFFILFYKYTDFFLMKKWKKKKLPHIDLMTCKDTFLRWQ